MDEIDDLMRRSAPPTLGARSGSALSSLALFPNTAEDSPTPR